MPKELRPEPVSEMATILAKGFLRYRKSLRLQAVVQPENDVASVPEPSRHVTVVNDQRTDED